MNRFGLLLCLSTYLLVGTDAALDAEGIVGGEIASPDEYSYQISMEDGRRLCGGSIIGDRHILTAAHCVTDKRAHFTNYAKKVVAGALDLKNKGPDAVTVDVEKVYIPKEYGLNGSVDDIAVLKLSKPLGLDDNEKLSKLELPEEDRTYAGEEATITGYGWTWAKLHTDRMTGQAYEEGDAAHMKKKFALTDVLPNAECGRIYLRPISSKQVCARVHQLTLETQGVCFGDSGGPLVYDDNVVIGIVSTSPLGCTERKAPAIYTRVSAYLDFIRNAMADRVTYDMKVYEHALAQRPIHFPTASPTTRPWYSILSFARNQA